MLLKHSSLSARAVSFYECCPNSVHVREIETRLVFVFSQISRSSVCSCRGPEGPEFFVQFRPRADSRFNTAGGKREWHTGAAVAQAPPHPSFALMRLRTHRRCDIVRNRKGFPTMRDTSMPNRRLISRREVLAAGGLSAVTALLGACSSTTSDSNGGTSTLGGAGPTTAPSRVALDDTTVKQLDDLLAQGVRATGVPGVSIGVWIGNQEWRRTVGVANLRTQAPYRPDDYARIASITKTFNGTAILQLVDAKKLSLDDKLDAYVSGIANGKEITIAQMLGMRSASTTSPTTKTSSRYSTPIPRCRGRWTRPSRSSRPTHLPSHPAPRSCTATRASYCAGL
jgi:hypothetical protein